VFYWGLLHCASVQTQYLWQFTTIQNMDWCSPFSAWQQFAGRSVSIEIELALKRKGPIAETMETTIKMVGSSSKG